MTVFAITYWELKHDEKTEKVEIYKDEDFPEFFSKALFYQTRPFDYNDLKVYKGELKEITLKKVHGKEKQE